MSIDNQIFFLWYKLLSNNSFTRWYTRISCRQHDKLKKASLQIYLLQIDCSIALTWEEVFISLSCILWLGFKIIHFWFLLLGSNCHTHFSTLYTSYLSQELFCLPTTVVKYLFFFFCLILSWDDAITTPTKRTKSWVAMRWIFRSCFYWMISNL